MSTYLEIVNKVLKRVRESSVGSVAENSYSALIGEFVNDAKRVVEDSWSWRCLLDTVTVPTVAGTESYNLQDYNCTNSAAPPRENARIFIDPDTSAPLIRITTNNYESFILKQTQSYEFINRVSASNDGIRGIPASIFFSVNVSATSGNTNLRVSAVPTPDAAYNIQFYLINPQNDLSSDSTSLIVPSFPVIQLAYLYALYERGEELGEMPSLTSAKADAALSDAIQFDSAMTSELIFRV